MALIKSVETPHGLVGTYHKITKAEVYTHNQTVVVHINMYANQESRASGKPFFWQEPVTIPFSAFTQNPLDILYPLIANYIDSPFADGTADQPIPEVQNFEIKLKNESRKNDEQVAPEEEETSA